MNSILTHLLLEISRQLNCCLLQLSATANITDKFQQSISVDPDQEQSDLGLL